MVVTLHLRNEKTLAFLLPKYYFVSAVVEFLFRNQKSP
jgi:hypothetical protein